MGYFFYGFMLNSVIVFYKINTHLCHPERAERGGIFNIMFQSLIFNS